MIIDFHTHAFPDKIATRAIPELQKKIELQPQTDGTLRDLSVKMPAWGIDRSVICNIATNPRQQTNVNNFALETRKKYTDLIPLGSIHPDSDNIEEELDRLINGGILGIKIHPDYMGHDITDKCFDKVFELCSAPRRAPYTVLFLEELAYSLVYISTESTNLKSSQRANSSFYHDLHCVSHSSTLAWKIPWMEEPGGLQSMGLLGVRHD